MKKRILSCALVLVMCLALVPMSAYAANVSIVLFPTQREP